MKRDIDAKQIDAILPQTQCGLCTYDGCMPYAKALANHEAEINLCPPGGVQGMVLIAELVGKDPSPFMAEMATKTKLPSRALIREAECIGCTKCIKACPVDAIIGSGKLMHTVLVDECTGCELCIAPCPVDCIDMIPAADDQKKRDHYRKRYEARRLRLQQEKTPQQHTKTFDTRTDSKKSYIASALLRAKNKKIS